jgi:hypothetical protein
MLVPPLPMENQMGFAAVDGGGHATRQHATAGRAHGRSDARHVQLVHTAVLITGALAPGLRFLAGIPARRDASVNRDHPRVHVLAESS